MKICLITKTNGRVCFRRERRRLLLKIVSLQRAGKTTHLNRFKNIARDQNIFFLNFKIFSFPNLILNSAIGRKTKIFLLLLSL